MIEQMKGLSFDDSIVLDFGTGTGILAILAEKMGAREIVAIDNDPWSMENAAQNIMDNGCRHIRLVESDKIAGADKFDMILANINRNILLEHMGSVSQHLKPHGVVIMSGLLTGDSAGIRREAEANGLKVTMETEREGWIVLQLIHNQL